MESRAELLRLAGVGKHYTRGRQRVDALVDLDLAVAPGECVALVGESGSGKSTAARIIAGLEPPDSGSVQVGGKDRAIRAGRLARAREVQIVFQDPYQSLDPRLSAGNAVLTTAKLHRSGESGEQLHARVESLLHQVGLQEEHWKTLPRALSGGQRQRVAIAKALAVNPSVLVLDEATSALDVSVQAQVLRLIQRLQHENEVALVFITHDLGIIEGLAQTTCVLRKGKVVEHGATADVLHRPTNPYTRLLLSSRPQLGWSPETIRRQKQALELADADAQTKAGE